MFQELTLFIISGDKKNEERNYKKKKSERDQDILAGFRYTLTPLRLARHLSSNNLFVFNNSMLSGENSQFIIS
jgi:hypothetical protein